MLDFETSSSKSEVSKSNLMKITSFSKTTPLQRELFLTMFYTMNLSPLLVTKQGFVLIIILSIYQQCPLPLMIVWNLRCCKSFYFVCVAVWLIICNYIHPVISRSVQDQPQTQESLDCCYTRMLLMALNISWQDHEKLQPVAIDYRRDQRTPIKVC